MAKINKFANIYSKDGELLRKAPLKNYTTEELEEVYDKMGNETPIKTRRSVFNLLMSYYDKYGNPHEAELREILEKAKNKKTDQEQAVEKLTEVAEEINIHPYETEEAEVIEEFAEAA